MAPALVIPQGCEVDQSRAELHASAVAVVSATGCTYLEALRQVSGPVIPHGFVVDSGQIETHERIARLAASRGCSYAEAVDLLNAEPSSSDAPQAASVSLAAKRKPRDGELVTIFFSGGTVIPTTDGH